MAKIGRLLFVLAVVLVAPLCASLAFGAAFRPTLLADAPHGFYSWQIRPAHIVYTGDGSGVLGGFDGSGARHALHPGHLTWTSWTEEHAAATGAVWLDDCIPDCARSTFTARAVRVVAFRPVKGHFTRMTLTYTDHGRRHIDKRGIERRGGYWQYFIVSLTPNGS